MTNYLLAPLAETDLEEIWEYLAREGDTELADRTITRLMDRFPALARMPRSGRSRPDIGVDMRSFPVGQYLIYYELPPTGRIVIARVLHGKRDQRAAFESI